MELCNLKKKQNKKPMVIWQKEDWMEMYNK